MAQGIFMMWTTGINARIARNTITNCARNCIELVNNQLGDDGSGFIVVQDNKITTATEGLARPTPLTPNGIVVGFLRGRSTAVERKRVIRTADPCTTSVVARGKTSLGINVLTDGALVRNNHVIIEGQEAGAIQVAGSHLHRPEQDRGERSILGFGLGVVGEVVTRWMATISSSSKRPMPT